jgi:hypothetical protein
MLSRRGAAVIVGCRAIPVQTAVFPKTAIVRPQNTWEHTFLRLLVQTLCETGQSAVVLCDRGFRRASWLQRLQALQQALVVRLIPDVLVYRGSCGGRRWRDWHLSPGQAVDLGVIRVRHAQGVAVRVVGVGALGQPELWWLATELTEPLDEIVALYDRRMALEEPFRDTKGGRFGVRLAWTPCRTPADLTRLTLLVGVALGRWTAVGQAVAKATPRVRLPCKRKGPRLSLLRVGIQFVTQIAPLGYSGVRFIRRHLPPPQRRRFTWLQAIEVAPCN